MNRHDGSDSAHSAIARSGYGDELSPRDSHVRGGGSARRLQWLRAPIALLALTLLAVLRSSWGTQLDSVNVDEPWHFVAGVEYARTGDFRLNPEHPPLTKLVTGAFAPADFTLRSYTPLASKEDERNLVEQTFFRDNDFRAAHEAARRAMFWLNGTLLFAFGLLLWRAAGLAFAMGVLGFLAIDPTVAAHMPVVLTDLPVALSLGITAAALALLLAQWQWRWVIASGIGMGLALAAKHSALPGVAALGLFAATAAVAQWARARAHRAPPALPTRFVMLLAVAAIAIALLWAMYGFHFHAGPDGSDRFNQPMPEKIAALFSARWRALIGFLDEWRLLPRSYLWGLTDTVRAGVDGRGMNTHLLWGTFIYGAPPWYTWPSFLLIKIPLALWALAMIGTVAIARLPDHRARRWLLRFALVLGVAHMLALGQSQGTYAGVRHALPALVAIAFLAGAAVQLATQVHAGRVMRVAVTVSYVLALIMTLPERRVWEYHNEIVGGNRGGAMRFGNEGLDLGQRAYEIAQFDQEQMAATGLPVYSAYWFAEEQAKALGLNYSRRVTSLADSNAAGVYEGYYIYSIADQVPWPDYHHDPAEVFRDITLVKSLGYVEIWKGRQVHPLARANSLWLLLEEYLYRDGGTDWRLVAQRGEEILSVNTSNFGAAIETGNAYIRLGQRDDARRWFAYILSSPRSRLLSDAVLAAVREMVQQLESDVPLSGIEPLRNPNRE